MSLNENARKWVEALRSGEFEQARFALRVDDSYCCLGVACEVYRRKTGDGRWVSEDNEASFFKPSNGNASNGYLPDAVISWLGLDQCNGSYAVSDSSKSSSLADRNDSGATFAEIADLIESEPEGLFVDEKRAMRDERPLSQVWAVKVTRPPIFTSQGCSDWTVVTAGTSSAAAHQVMRQSSVHDLREGVTIEVFPVADTVELFTAQYSDPQPESRDRLVDYGELLLTRERRVA